MIDEDAYKRWLEDGGAESPAGRNTRVYALRTIEKKLDELGMPFDDLASAWQEDRFAALSERLRQMRDDASDGARDYRVLMPQAKKKPMKRISSWRSWLAQYGRFLDDDPPGPAQAKDADRIRRYVLEHHIEPAREKQQAQTDVLVRDVNTALSLNDAWPNICQALAGSKFQKLAAVPPPTRIGREQSSATVFRFDLNGEETNVLMPMNLILYGPPGTGKTYSTAAAAVGLCGKPPEDRGALMDVYQRLLETGRIEFVTFHQSMSYEDFVEGRQPMTGADDDADGSSVGFRLKAVPGIFRRVAARATGSAITLADRRVFKMSIGEANNAEDAHFFEEAVTGGYALLSWYDIDWSDDRYADKEAILDRCKEEGHDVTAKSGGVQMPFTFRNRVQEGDIVIVSKGNSLFRAIGEFTGGYEFHPRPEGRYAHRRTVRWRWTDHEGVPVSEIYTRNFTQHSIYALDASKLNIPALERYINSQHSDAPAEPEPFVLIIDEINRANISKVFGELITLLEPDKRLGQPNELKVRLPYSGDAFGVPSNLHILATMNTADRSIALLDTALRRRFTFREMMPDASLLEEAAKRSELDLPRILNTLNERIEYLYDREHQIGHAYFIDCASRADVDAVMRDRVIPLLTEYFFEDWEKVAAVLGDAVSPDGKGGFLNRSALKPPPGIEDGEELTRYRWQIRSEEEGFDYEGLTGA